jgi:hypothetical protein
LGAAKVIGVASTSIAWDMYMAPLLGATTEQRYGG